MNTIPELYFKSHEEWYTWLDTNHNLYQGVYLILFTVKSTTPSMRWEDAVKVAICFGWIDSTVKKLNDEKRKQYFCPRRPKSSWSKLNKTYVDELFLNNKMHKSGIAKIEAAKKDGSYFELDDVENLIIPTDLLNEFNHNKTAYTNYLNFSKTYKKSYLSWLNQAKRKETRLKRIQEIIKLCEKNLKTR